MRFLIHYTGDIHQPLHGSTRVDHEYPEGDRGGNSFPVTAKDGAKNLHAVWDSVAYEFTGYPTLPFSDADWKENGEQAAALVKKYPLSSLKDTTNLNPMTWAMESFEVTKSFVYKDISEGESLPEEYV